MKKSFSLMLIIGLAVISLSAQTTEKFIRAKEGKRIPNSYIVVLAKSLNVTAGDDKKVTEIARSLNLVFNKNCDNKQNCITQIYTYALTGFSMFADEQTARRISQNPQVEYVAEDIEVNINTTQNNATWGLDRIDSRTLPLDTNYNYTPTGNGVNVYVIDTGIKFSHSEFGGRAVLGADFVGDGQNGNDCQGHGTHVAGTIGGNNYGVAKNAKLYSVRIFPCVGGSAASTTIAAINWVTAYSLKPAVVNMSLGGNYFLPLNQAVKNSSLLGNTYVVAAGNETVNACTKSPASVPEAITVGSSTNTDAISNFSNIGNCVDLFAPGTNILSAGILSNTANKVMSGTSMAAPHVAGVAALYLEKKQSALPAEVTNEIICSATSNKLTGIGNGSPNLLLFSPLIWEPGPNKIKNYFIPRCGLKKATSTNITNDLIIKKQND